MVEGFLAGVGLISGVVAFGVFVKAHEPKEDVTVQQYRKQHEAQVPPPSKQEPMAA